MGHESNIITPGNKPFIATRFLPKTGQTITYLLRDDGTYKKGWSIGSRFVVKTIGGERIVYDRATHLFWAGDADLAGGYNGNAFSWGAVINYYTTLDFAGYTDWRLPNIFELESIICFGAASPAVYPATFLNVRTAPYNYWSSTSKHADPTKAWGIYFAAGARNQLPKIEIHFSLGVRSGSP